MCVKVMRHTCHDLLHDSNSKTCTTTVPLHVLELIKRALSLSMKVQVHVSKGNNNKSI